MTVGRLVGLLVILTAIGLGVVGLRVDQARHTRKIQELQFHQTDLRRRMWQQEMELARLRSPQLIRERAQQFGLASSRTEPEKPASPPKRR